MRSAWKTLGALRQGGDIDRAAAALSSQDLHNAMGALTLFADALNCSPTQAVECARLLMGQYRARDFVDPEIFAPALSSVFEAYPHPLCSLSVDPLVGLPSSSRFPPSVSEVREWLDREQGRLSYYFWRVQEVTKAQQGGNGKA